MKLNLTLELSPYGFPVRVEVVDGRARVLAREPGVDGWEEAGEARIIAMPTVARARPRSRRLRRAA